MMYISSDIRVRNLDDVKHVVNWLLKKRKVDPCLAVPYMAVARSMWKVAQKRKQPMLHSELNATCVSWLFRGLNWHVLTDLRILVGEMDKSKFPEGKVRL